MIKPDWTISSTKRGVTILEITTIEKEHADSKTDNKETLESKPE